MRDLELNDNTLNSNQENHCYLIKKETAETGSERGNTSFWSSSHCNMATEEKITNVYSSDVSTNYKKRDNLTSSQRIRRGPTSIL
jgi:hypothetical protein